ncbi:MAG: hypothetical protein N2511_08335 [Thermodesulfovibrionales bacterium]|nr:hypothetical protein [Thermodesulfovibrionales bacterium]
MIELPTTLTEWSTVIGSLATLIVAIITLINVRTIRSQQKMLEKQVLIQRSSLCPFIEIKNVDIEGNTFRLNLVNRGNGSAVFLGLLLHFLPYNPLDPNSISAILYALKDGKKVRIYPNDLLVFLRTETGKSNLHPNECCIFSAEATFYYTYYESIFEGINREVCKFLSFDELKAILLDNGFSFAAISAMLVYKDIAEEYIGNELIFYYVADLRKHTSIQEVFKDRIPFKQRTIFIEEEGKFIPWEIYKEGKSSRGILELN